MRYSWLISVSVPVIVLVSGVGRRWKRTAKYCGRWDSTISTLPSCLVNFNGERLIYCRFIHWAPDPAPERQQLQTVPHDSVIFAILFHRHLCGVRGNRRAEPFAWCAQRSCSLNVNKLKLICWLFVRSLVRSRRMQAKIRDKPANRWTIIIYCEFSDGRQNEFRSCVDCLFVALAHWSAIASCAPMMNRDLELYGNAKYSRNENKYSHSDFRPKWNDAISFTPKWNGKNWILCRFQSSTRLDIAQLRCTYAEINIIRLV